MFTELLYNRVNISLYLLQLENFPFPELFEIFSWYPISEKNNGKCTHIYLVLPTSTFWRTKPVLHSITEHSYSTWVWYFNISSLSYTYNLQYSLKHFGMLVITHNPLPRCQNSNNSEFRNSLQIILFETPKLLKFTHIRRYSST